MDTNRVKNNVKKNAKNAKNVKGVGMPSWDAAIEDAECLIEKYRNEIAKLKGSIQVFIERRNAGVPWPGEKT